MTTLAYISTISKMNFNPYMANKTTPYNGVKRLHQVFFGR